MPALYRMVLFVPDPFTEGRVPIAALVDDGQKVTVVQAPHRPCAECLGGVAADALVDIILSDLNGITTIDHLPESVGPQVMLSVVRKLPDGVKEPVAWVAHVWTRPVTY
jgi:hypothetical protein